PEDQSFVEFARTNLPYFFVFILVWLAAGTDQKLFGFPREANVKRLLLVVLKSVLVALIFSGFVITFFTRQGIRREFFLAFGILVLVLVLSFRLALRLFLEYARKQGFNFRRIVVVGANERSKKLIEIIQSHLHYGYHVMGFFDEEERRKEVFEPHHVEYLGTCDDLDKMLWSNVIDEVYICLPVRSHYETIRKIVFKCEGVGLPVRMVAELFPLRLAHSHLSHFEDLPLLSLSTVPEAHGRLLVKRILDFTVASVALVAVGSWLFPLVALLIKLDSRGPVFFKQKRVGQNGRVFHIYKFRSMVQDAEERKKELEAVNEADGPVFKMRRDPRVTRVGAILRKMSIDELPQFINVWLGHMSLVGPRPPLPSEVEKYSWAQRRRLSVRPGLTGLQQVSGRSDVSFDDWVAMDLAYIDEWSLTTDLQIILLTVRVVLLGKGAR
ncbi:MAG: sugar transferase, partial [Candidatus Hydrogenedentes bacterium]|nr:sugar transferase [Candidatus Hydrogenedentota bacterium]